MNVKACKMGQGGRFEGRAGVSEPPLHGPADAAHAADWISGACLLVRRDAWELVGGFDTKFFLYYEETDWCLRARQAGWQVHQLPTVRVRHDGALSAKRTGRTIRNGCIATEYVRSRRRYFQKHFGLLSSAAVELLHALRAGYDRVRPEVSR